MVIKKITITNDSFQTNDEKFEVLKEKINEIIEEINKLKSNEET